MPKGLRRPLTPAEKEFNVQVKSIRAVLAQLPVLNMLSLAQVRQAVEKAAAERDLALDASLRQVADDHPVFPFVVPSADVPRGTVGDSVVGGAGRDAGAPGEVRKAGEDAGAPGDVGGAGRDAGAPGDAGAAVVAQERSAL